MEGKYAGVGEMRFIAGPHETEIAYMPRHTPQQIGEAALRFEDFTPIQEAYGSQETVRDQLQGKIIDQDPAIDAIISALERKDVRLEGDNRPVATFMFLGPTGVGKSQTAKELARIYGGEQVNLIKIDCSNYSHGHEVADLVGSPTGYVGHTGTTPRLAKKHVERKNTVVLFDEIEKGSRELENILLQVTGDGDVEIKNGPDANFRDVIVIMTSNLGAKEMAKTAKGTELGFGGVQQAAKQADIEKVGNRELEKRFSPEFLNRLTERIVFHPLSSEGLGKVLDMKLAAANEEYKRRYGVRISLSDATREHIVGIGAEESQYGARPLVRAFESDILTTFGRYLSTGYIPDGTHFHVWHRSETPEDYDDGSDSPLIFTSKPDATLKKNPIPKPTDISFRRPPQIATAPCIYDERQQERDWGVIEPIVKDLKEKYDDIDKTRIDNAWKSAAAQKVRQNVKKAARKTMDVARKTSKSSGL